jgi:CRP/FNR family transcriptional regulator, cyclic AMP receptor protein
MAHAASFDPKTFLGYMGAGRTLVKYRKNRKIFSQGDRADSVFYIQKGNVKLAVVSERGKEAVVAILGANDFLGETCLAGQTFRMASASAIAECTLMKIEKPAMIRVLHEEPAFSEYFLAYLLSHIVRVQEQLINQLFNSSEKRLARTLLLLAHFGKEEKAERVVPRITQETLAEMIGATRETVNHFMNKFKNLGFIDYDEGLKVHSSLLSVVLSD